jgi:UDP-N-acetylglucosamine 2-epimerase (non-hydrolysing)
MTIQARFRILIVVGTRPDALKMHPVYLELKKAGQEVIVISTMQHTELLNQVFEELDFFPDYSLDVMVEDQRLSNLTGKLAVRLEEAFSKFSPDLVLVQGDTTSSMVGALISYYHRIPVNHVEAGLRTGDPFQPFPEEINRKIITHIADFHFAPTPRSRDNLTMEGIDLDRVMVTGNTAIDTLLKTLEKGHAVRDKRLEEILGGDSSLITVTAHRRESFGEPLGELTEALEEITSSLDGVRVVYPVHPNPSVREPVTKALSGKYGIDLIDPLGYSDLIRLLDASRLILTDSGGIQEEAPSLGKPVVVLREVTERMESIEAGIALLVGMDRKKIVQAVSDLILEEKRYDAMVPIENPYGDGRAAKRIADSILFRYHGKGSPPEDFKGSISLSREPQ